VGDRAQVREHAGGLRRIVFQESGNITFSL
jgi:hypothetical protein